MMQHIPECLMFEFGVTHQVVVYLKELLIGATHSKNFCSEITVVSSGHFSLHQ